MLRRAYIGLGANLPSAAGAPIDTLHAAIARIAGLGKVVRQSGLYRTRPISDVKQPFFLNAVVILETTFDPESLLKELLRIEQEFGRDRAAVPPKGPRSLDLDLLLVDDLKLSIPFLTLPHPEFARRRFVLAPLAEVAPQLRDPVTGHTVEELLAALPTEGENGLEAVQPGED
jgi:2-amino-4-hydroxy-6-hydroxymethyldihydropteridine diphosphokinase